MPEKNIVEKPIEAVHTFTQMVAKKQGWLVTSDAAFYEDLSAGLQANFNRYGYFLCPCRDSEGSREDDRKAICPCAWSGDDIHDFGHCFCGLYLSPDFASSGKDPGAIPDRRYDD